MPRLLHRLSSSLLPLLASLAMASAVGNVALSQPAKSSDEDASAHFERGKQFFKDADYEAALAEFKRAYEINPNYQALYNLGQTSRELHDYATALTTFQRYLKEGGSEIEEGRRKTVEGLVNELKGKIATVTLKVNVDGAEVTLDDAAVGTTPLAAPIVMNAGRRKIGINKSGYNPMQRNIDVAGTDEKTIPLELIPFGAPVPPGGDQNPPPAKSLNPSPFVMLGITGATLITTGVLGGLALSAKSDFNTALGTFPGSSTDIEAARSKAKNLGIATDVMGSVTIASAVVTTILLATANRSHTEEKPKTEPEVKVKVGLGSAFVTGTF